MTSTSPSSLYLLLLRPPFLSTPRPLLPSLFPPPPPPPSHPPELKPSSPPLPSPLPFSISFFPFCLSPTPVGITGKFPDDRLFQQLQPYRGKYQVMTWRGCFHSFICLFIFKCLSRCCTCCTATPKSQCVFFPPCFLKTRLFFFVLFLLVSQFENYHPVFFSCRALFLFQ